MARRAIQVSAAVAALASVLSAAAYSSHGPWRLDFAQYAGSEQRISSEDFRFVIVGDRTSSPEWGLMPQAFQEINQLSPDFVISVGDLIDGYGDNPRSIQQLWREFDEEVAKLKSPFVYIPGNHDIWNATSRGIYEARYGSTYRSFNYRGLHFITLDTEEQDDFGRVRERIADKQLQWLKEDLAQNRGASHTLLFMHRPIWQTGGLDEVYPLLSAQRTHIFAGHIHRYSFETIHEIPHVVLSAVAGSLMGKESIESGNFRHYVFATVRGSDVRLAIIRLGGVFSPSLTFQKGT
jgi:predicted MPP superfamily phosphohydrolase